ncbi:uncharacterized protein LOC121868240 [Homarus americanus]|nr:uncharacterized protein LOC121868240 [Homarus americanus]
MTAQQEKLYFPVDNVTLYDLFDWKKESTWREKLSGQTLTCWHDHAFTDPPKFKSCRPAIMTATRVKVNGHELALFRFGNTVCAIDEKCPHAGGPLHAGDIEELPNHTVCVRCPYHRWAFSLRDGKCKEPDFHGKLFAKVYPVKVDLCKGQIKVGFDSFHPSCFQDCIE